MITEPVQSLLFYYNHRLLCQKSIKTHLFLVSILPQTIFLSLNHAQMPHKHSQSETVVKYTIHLFVVFTLHISVGQTHARHCAQGRELEYNTYRALSLELPIILVQLPLCVVFQIFKCSHKAFHNHFSLLTLRSSFGSCFIFFAAEPPCGGLKYY